MHLLDAGYAEDEIWKLLRLIDGLMPLPDELMAPFRENLHQLHHPDRMPYVTSFERLSRQEGLQEGLRAGVLRTSRESILDVLETRFAGNPSGLAAQVNAVDDERILKEWLRRANLIPHLDQF